VTKIENMMFDSGFKIWRNRTFFSEFSDINCMYSMELRRNRNFYRLSGYLSFTSISFENEWRERQDNFRKSSLTFPICQHVWNFGDDQVRDIFLDYVTEDQLYDKLALLTRILDSKSFCFDDFDKILQTGSIFETPISSWVPDPNLYGSDSIIIKKFNAFVDWIEPTVPSARSFLTLQ
jgi:hypothetical protein